MHSPSAMRTRLSVVPVFLALLLNVLVGPLAPALQAGGTGNTALAAPGDVTVTQAEDASGCMGVVSTPGSENTNKRLLSGSLEPGGTASFEISFPVDAADVGGDFRITDCVFIDADGDGDTEESEAVAKYFVDFVPNNENFVLTFTLNIPADAPIGDEYCNFAKTTESPSQSQASNRKAGPACFIIGGALRVSKVDQAGAPLRGATFSVSCSWPTSTSSLAATVIGAPDDGSVTDGNDANTTNDATESFTSTSGGVLNVTAVTGSDGVISVNAPVGTSCTFTETAAPNGYLPPTPPNNAVTLVVPSGGASATHTFVNTRAVPDAVLRFDKSADQSPIDAGEEASYTLTVWNAGPGDALNVRLHDDLPPGLAWDFEIVSGDAAKEDCDVASSQVEGGESRMSIDCDFGTLGVTDEAGGIVIRVFADTDRTDCGQLENNAWTDASNADRIDRDATITVECPMTTPVPTLVIDKVADTEVVTITGPSDDLEADPSVVTWTLTYTLTNGPVTNAVITDEVPEGFDFLDASDGGVLVDGVVTWTFATLTESGSVTFRTTVDPDTISRVAPTVNVAVIDSDETEPDEGEDSVTVEVVPPPLGGNPTPRPRLPDTASGIGLNGEPITVPLELLATFFIGSLGALALANVKARNRRR